MIGTYKGWAKRDVGARDVGVSNVSPKLLPMSKCHRCVLNVSVVMCLYEMTPVKMMLLKMIS